MTTAAAPPRCPACGLPPAPAPAALAARRHSVVLAAAAKPWTTAAPARTPSAGSDSTCRCPSPTEAGDEGYESEPSDLGLSDSDSECDAPRTGGSSRRTSTLPASLRTTSLSPALVLAAAANRGWSSLPLQGAKEARADTSRLTRSVGNPYAGIGVGDIGRMGGWAGSAKGRA